MLCSLPARKNELERENFSVFIQNQEIAGSAKELLDASGDAIYLACYAVYPNLGDMDPRVAQFLRKVAIAINRVGNPKISYLPDPTKLTGVLSMLNTILRKRAQALALILVLSVLLVAATAFAATEIIKAKRGGVVCVGPGVSLEIKPRGLEEDAIVSADMKIKRNRISFSFSAVALDDGDDVELTKPAVLCISWQAIGGVEDLTLYGEHGEEIEPAQTTKRVVKYYVDHFSIYYFRRR